jgi:hypothetical protein
MAQTSIAQPRKAFFHEISLQIHSHTLCALGFGLLTQDPQRLFGPHGSEEETLTVFTVSV